MNLFTIGANETLAESFFGRLADRGVRTVVDVRVSRDSAFFGFAKERDLPYYLRKLCGAGYRVEESLAPTRELLRERERGLPWAAYEREYRSLLERRDAIASLRRDDFEGACLLCREAGPEECHRRIAAELMADAWPGTVIVHV